MSTVLWIVGVVVLVAVLLDVSATVVRPDGSGLLATGVSRAVWRSSLWLHRRRPVHGRLATGGVLAVVLMPVTWMIVMWAGWTLVFHGAPDAVVDGRTSQPVDGWGRVYFAGFSLFTSGLGDLVPGGAPWRVATALASAMGLGLVTLAVTFLVPVIQAANDRRAVAQSIHHLGSTAREIVERHETSEFHALAARVADLPAALTKLALQHHSYPVLDHFHSPDVRQALMPRLATLLDACLVAVPESAGTDRAHLDAVVGAIDSFSRTVTSDADVGADDRIDTAVGVWSPERAERLAAAAPTRARLRLLVDADGWSWEDDVLGPLRT